MGRSARVTSIETVQRFRNALCEFAKDAKDSLGAVEMQIHRTFDWLTERLKHWQREVRVRQEELVRAKIELESRKLANRGGKGPGFTDQEKAFRKAQASLKEAEDKVAACKRWHPALEHAVREYQGPARQLSSSLDIDLVHSLAILDQKLAALEAYLSLAPPSAPSLATGASSAEGVGLGDETTVPAVAVPDKKAETESEQAQCGNPAEEKPATDSRPLTGLGSPS
jgi:hypothetical protein